MADIKAEIRSPTIKANVYRATIPDSGENEIYQGEYAVTPSSEEQTLETKGMIMRKDVTVHKIPDDYIIPTGDIDIVKNGEVDISHYKTANVNVPLKYDEGYSEGYDSGYSEGFDASQKTIILQEKTVTENGDVTADEGFTGLSKVNVAIPIKEEQEKSLPITENGTYSVLPDENKVLSSVSLEVDVKDETLAEIETTIDESGVLDSTEGTVAEKVEQLVDLAEESANKWQGDTSEVIYERSCYQNAEISCLITENGTLTYKRNKFSNKNQAPKWSFNNINQTITPLGMVGVSAWLKVEQAEVINVPEATEEYLITALEQSCFCSLYSLKRVRLPDTITKIGNNAFSYCISLKEVNLPDTIGSFGSDCFSYCYSLEEFDIPPLVTSLPSFMFRIDSKLTKINGAEILTSIGSNCFNNCVMLKEITFGKNLSTVDEAAFSYCISLKKVQSKSNSITFGKNVFSNCNGLEDVSFISGSIQNSVFFAQSKLLSADSIQSIIDGLATVETAQTLTLPQAITLTDEQKATIYSKGWTLAQ